MRIPRTKGEVFMLLINVLMLALVAYLVMIFTDQVWIARLAGMVFIMYFITTELLILILNRILKKHHQKEVVLIQMILKL